MKRAPLGAAVAAGGAWLRDDRATVDAGQTNGMTVEKRYLTDICPVQRGRCHPGAWLTVDHSSRSVERSRCAVTEKERASACKRRAPQRAGAPAQCGCLRPMDQKIRRSIVATCESAWRACFWQIPQNILDALDGGVCSVAIMNDGSVNVGPCTRPRRMSCCVQVLVRLWPVLRWPLE